MAEKKFEQMSNKKLTALLGTASDEDKVAIQAVLDERTQAKAKAAEEKAKAAEEVPQTSFEGEAHLTEEEQAALDAAEANGGINPTYTGKMLNKSGKITDEERKALAEQLKVNINHRCQAVPFNTAEWVDGYIAGVIEEKRTNKVLYAIKTDDGRRIVKVHDSNLVKILDEVITPEKAVRARKSKEGVEKVDWTPEQIAEEIADVIGNVGKVVEFEKYRTPGEDGQEQVVTQTGRIVAIVPDKRAQRLLYRIHIPAPMEGNPLAVKVMHKVVSKAAELNISAEFDEDGAAMNAAYCGRRETAATRTPLTPQDRFVRCEENLKKAEENLKKATEDLEAKKKQLEEAKAELDAYLAGQSGAPEAVAEENESLD